MAVAMAARVPAEARPRPTRTVARAAPLAPLEATVALRISLRAPPASAVSRLGPRPEDPASGALTRRRRRSTASRCPGPRDAATGATWHSSLAVGAVRASTASAVSARLRVEEVSARRLAAADRAGRPRSRRGSRRSRILGSGRRARARPAWSPANRAGRRQLRRAACAARRGRKAAARGEARPPAPFTLPRRSAERCFGARTPVGRSLVERGTREALSGAAAHRGGREDVRRGTLSANRLAGPRP